MIEKYKLEIEKLLGIKIGFKTFDKTHRFNRPLKDYDFAYVKEYDSGLTIHVVKDESIEGTHLTMSNIIASFTLVQLNGCCGICVSTGALVDTNFQGKGLGTLLNNFRQEIAKCQGYTVLLCTDQDKNERQRAILKKNGWKDVYKFTNKRTGNLLNITIKEL